MKDYCTKETAEALKALGMMQDGYERYWGQGEIHYPSRRNNKVEWVAGKRYDAVYYAAPSAGEAIEMLPPGSMIATLEGGYICCYNEFTGMDDILAEAVCLLLKRLFEEGVMQ